jgi:hypothetical protein
MQTFGVLLRRPQQLGVRLEYPCEVTGISVTGARVHGEQTNNGPIAGDFLLAHSTPQPRILERIAFAPGTNIKPNPDGRIVTGTDFEATATPKLLIH